MRTHLTALLLSVVALGCTSTPDGTTILAEGSGPTNAAPLLPLVVGQVHAARVVDATPQPGRVRVHSDREAVDYRMDEDGASIVWMAGIGELERPLWEVPSTVRMGMRWETDPGDPLPVFTYEVVGRTEDVETRYGKRTQWLIQQSVGGVEGDLIEYIEGVGWTPYLPEAAIIPLESPNLTFPASPMLEPESIEFTTTGAWQVRDLHMIDVGPSESLIIAYGRVPCPSGGA